jgi:flagellar motor switch protein FliM
MSDTSSIDENATPGVLARIVAAHARKAAVARDRTDLLSSAWHRALRHAAVPFKALHLSPTNAVVEEHVPLATALDGLPDHGLIAVLEDRDGARGLIALSHGTIDALVEVQTTGRVDARELPPRPVTRIDEALCRDFIDLSLAAFSRETERVEDRDWPRRMGFGSRIADRRQLSLLLPDRLYHRMTAEFDLGEDGPRQGQAVLVLPRTQDPPPRATSPTGGQVTPEAWRAAMEAAMAGAELRLDAVLLRTTRSLREVEALAPGDLIAFDASDLARVGLETPGGRTILRGRLGQMGGLRALRMAEASPVAQPMSAPAPQVPTAADAPPLPATPDPGGALGFDPVAESAGPPDAPDLPAQGDAAEPDATGDPGLTMPQPAPLDIVPATVPIDPDALPE